MGMMRFWAVLLIIVATKAVSAPMVGNYLPCPRPVVLPTYDSQDSDHVMVTSLAELNAAINNTAPVIFIQPGDYFVDGNTILEVTADGAQGDPRYLIYYDPSSPNDETHPANMLPADRAVVRNIRFFGASWWVIDRLTIEGQLYRQYISGAGDPARADTTGDGVPLDDGTAGPFEPSSYNIFHRVLFDEPIVASANTGLMIYSDCHHNSFQFNVNRNFTLPTGDGVAYITMGWRGIAGNADVHGTCFYGNEIYNVNDGIQLFNQIGFPAPDYRGTIIEDNDIYMTTDYYSDCNGNLTPTGTCAGTENAMDFKCGSQSSLEEDWVMVVNNRMWGWRFLDPNLGGSNAHGSAVIMHNGPGSCTLGGNVLFRNNIVFDSVNGLNIAELPNISLIGNIVYDTKRLGHDGVLLPYENSATLWIGGDNQELYHNLSIKGDQRWSHQAAVRGFDLVNNIISDNGGYYMPTTVDVVADYNGYYGATQMPEPGTNDITRASTVIPGHNSLFLTIKRITGPEVVEIPYGKPTRTSPLFTSLQPSPGARAGYGVDNNIWPVSAAWPNSTVNSVVAKRRR